MTTPYAIFTLLQISDLAARILQNFVCFLKKENLSSSVSIKIAFAPLTKKKQKPKSAKYHAKEI
ncbi:hypothetical protein LAC1533_0277 [Ligilactobacillus acidipiscis]|uniref:Uncharacterized protein n=1 Tax=Ligilactobacillus acidipiscis TaxID=89059 RepID=A0A1K1KQK4_9LACO|nr:hypothetical protein LAC1533_0277 [Ligilactobacillus acidipiscis]